jgi:hypothetical protein
MQLDDKDKVYKRAVAISSGPTKSPIVAFNEDQASEGLAPKKSKSYDQKRWASTVP